MFKIGDFSKVAQVSGRLLRYYDEIGLFAPAYTDTSTGYRYYTAEQLPELNRILALKHLGLSLDQIARMIQDNISSDEIRGMLLLKKSQIEQNLREEFFRLQAVETRLRQIEHQGEWSDLPVVIKEIPPQPFLSSRKRDVGDHGFYPFYDEVMSGITASNARKYGSCICITHSEMMDDIVDMELGFVVENEAVKSLALPNHPAMEMRILSGAQVASIVHVGTWTTGMESYQALGLWVEHSGFKFSGPGREILIEVAPAYSGENNVFEIQFPIEPEQTLLH